MENLYELFTEYAIFIGSAFVVFILLVWLYLSLQRKNNKEDDDIYASELYFSEQLLNPEPVVPAPELVDEPFEIEESKQPIEEPVSTENPPPPPKKPPEELIIFLYVVAKPNQSFSGTDIFSVLDEVGVNYGDMKIFHHYGVGELKVKTPVFSIANMLEPGTFDPKFMEDFTTSGIVLFMRLPGPLGGRVSFELMLNNAQRIAEMLEGQVKDERRKNLEPEMIDTLRDRIAEFEKR